MRGRVARAPVSLGYISVQLTQIIAKVIDTYAKQINHISFFLIFLIPSTLFAMEEVKTGYDLYHNLQLMDNPQNSEDITNGLLAVGYLKGCVDGFILMQDAHYNKMFPPNMMSEKERIKISKELNFHRINMPLEGIATGQLILIYNKFAKEHPKKLNGRSRLCIWESIVNAYGWK